MATITKDTGRLALRFAQEIREWYADDSRKWAAMLARNEAQFAATGYYGATNDDYDANMAMDAAWRDVLPDEEYDPGSQAHAVLCNGAWALAAYYEFDDARIKAALA